MSERKTTTPKRVVPGGSLLAGCNCVNPWQDERYGRSIRVHNYTKDVSADNTKVRCTACGVVKKLN